MRLAIPTAALLALALQGCRPPAVPTRAAQHPIVIEVEPRIVTAEEVTTEAELADRGERALAEERWVDAQKAYATLVAADPSSPHAEGYLFNLGLALEGMGDRPKARDAFVALSRRFPHGDRAKVAFVRAATLDAYLEDWVALAAIGEALLARSDLDDVDRLVALGSRGLARVEAGDDMAASRDILDGLELGDRLHYGDRDVLPVALAQLRFALGEVRRIRSERVKFDPVPDDFVDRLENRCAGLMQAQAAYALAVRSVDPHWAAMSGYRVGAMYRTLHHDLMQIPAPARSKTEKQKKIFYAFMHLRYRILLEKGLREIDQTIALGARTSDSSAWVARAREAKEEMEAALAAEHDELEAMPFTEVEVNAALQILQKRALTTPAQKANATRQSPRDGGATETGAAPPDHASH